MNGNDHQRFVSDRTTAWLLEYFLTVSTAAEGGVHIPAATAATEITGVTPPDRDILQRTATAWSRQAIEDGFAEPGRADLPYYRAKLPTTRL